MDEAIPVPFIEATSEEQGRARVHYMEAHREEWASRSYDAPDEEWCQPSDAWLQPILAAVSGTRAEQSVVVLEVWYWDERAAAWMLPHTERATKTLEELRTQWREELDKAIPLPRLSHAAQALYDDMQHHSATHWSGDYSAHADFWEEIGKAQQRGDPSVMKVMAFQAAESKRTRQVLRWAYERAGLVPFLNSLWKPEIDPPTWLLRHLHIIDRDSPSLIELPPKTPVIPSVFRDGKAVLPSSLPVQGIFAALAAAQLGIRPSNDAGWHQTPSGMLYYPHAKRSGTILTSWQLPDGGMITPEIAALLVSKFRQIESDLDGDVLSALLAQAMLHSEPDGSTWITAASILDYRGIEPVWHREGGTCRRGSHRTERIEDISQSMSRLNHLWVELQQVKVFESHGGRRAKHPSFLTLNDKVITIAGNITQKSLLDSPAVPIAWRYRLGDWLAPFLTGSSRQTALLLQKILEYDPYRQIWEKRLGRYLTFHFRIDSKTRTPLVRKVETLLEECWLPIDTRNPQRTRDRLELALACMKNDDIFETWQYPIEHGVSPSLPARNWFPAFKQWSITFTPKSDIAAHYPSPGHSSLLSQSNDHRDATGA